VNGVLMSSSRKARQSASAIRSIMKFAFMLVRPTLRLTYRRRGGRWSGEKMHKFT